MEDGDIIRNNVKQEFLGDEVEASLPNIREMADKSGDFLKNINSNYELISPIQPSRDEIRAAGLERSNAYQHNMNLSLELQNIVNEHLMMEEYPAADDYLAGLDHEAPIDMPLDFMGGAQNNDLTMMGGDEGIFFLQDIGDGTAIAQGGVSLLKKTNKKQVQQIRQAMMKHDKRIQKAQF